ncbi:MAG: DUF1501 domain-containing protein, partial [Planctomycetaceae bacterium]|nr:DUF1501 domain-containing protein [Planctomycetaceae bacterium]
MNRSRGHCRQFFQPDNRRAFLNNAACGFGAVALSHLFGHSDGLVYGQNENRSGSGLAPKPTHHDPRATSVIFLYMDGGVSQVDSFDPKPRLKDFEGRPFPSKMEPTQFNNIGNTLPSPWQFRQYGESGIPVSDLFRQTAKHVDEMAVVRSMVSNFPEHTNANYFLHTGNGQQGRPSMGAWFGYGLGTECQDLPHFVVLNGGLIPPGGIDNFGSGFLPASYQASVFANGDPPVSDIKPRESSAELQRKKLDVIRRMDLASLDRYGRDDQVESAIANYELAARMQL